MIRSRGKRDRRTPRVGNITTPGPRPFPRPAPPVTSPVVDVYARQPHHIDHLAPIVAALPSDIRGTFTVPTRAMVGHAAARGVTAVVGAVGGHGAPVMVASWADIPAARPFIMVEHGVGQAYQDAPAPGTAPRACGCGLAALLAPNGPVGWRNELHHPHAVTTVVGSAKVERYAAIRAAAPRDTGRPTVAFVWHWNSPLCPAARWAFPHWAEAVAAFPADRFDVIGHGHPRAWRALASFYRSAGIPAVPDPEDVIRRADVVVADNTSFAFECAAVGIPVVWLDAPWYPTGVDWGPRFGAFDDIGLHAAGGTVGALVDVVAATLADDPCGARRGDVGPALYAGPAGSTDRSVAAVRAAVHRP
jgi:hypothetical protein